MKRIDKLTAAEKAELDKISMKDSDKWDSGECGTDPKKQHLVSKELETELNAKKVKKGVFLSLPEDLIDDLKDLARSDNLGYQTFIRYHLTRLVRAKKYGEKDAS